MPRVKFIVNPNADLGRAWRMAADLRPIVDEYGGADWAGTVYPTHGIELAHQAALDGYDLIIAAGGDGTAHEVINGLMRIPKEQRPMLGVVPMGTGNDFSHAVGVHPSAPVAMRQIFTGKPRPVDIGKLMDDHGRVEYWGNAVGIGFDAAAVIHVRRFTYLRGYLAYLVALFQTLARHHESARLTVSTDIESWEHDTLMLVLCNGGREGGAFFVSPDARPDDGLYNYAWVERVSRLRIIRLIPEVMRGTHGRFPEVRTGQFRRMELQSDRPLIIHTDGEIFAGFGVDVRQLSVEIQPGAIEIIS